MKSLKRTLCLVLALVMVLGLFGIASAASFTDDNTIQYKEAVEVVTGIGAINGMGDGTFNPNGTITRAQAAKLVTYVALSKGVADNLTGVTSQFTDVTAAGGFAWAIPSIEYLVKEGTINGRGDGTFDPNGEISGYAVLKLLLCSLGYGAKDEYVGDGWDLQVAIDANKAGLTAGRVSTAALSAPATREEVALYCYNALGGRMVVYNKLTDKYDTIGTTSAYAGDSEGRTLADEVYGLKVAEGVVTSNGAISSADAKAEKTTIKTVAASPKTYNFKINTGLNLIGHYVKVYYRNATAIADANTVLIEGSSVVDLTASVVTVGSTAVSDAAGWVKAFGSTSVAPAEKVFGFTASTYADKAITVTNSAGSYAAPANSSYVVYKNQVVSAIENPAITTCVVKNIKNPTSANPGEVELAGITGAIPSSNSVISSAGKIVIPKTGETDPTILATYARASIYEGIAKGDVAFVQQTGDRVAVTKANMITGTVSAYTAASGTPGNANYVPATVTVGGTAYPMNVIASGYIADAAVTAATDANKLEQHSAVGAALINSECNLYLAPTGAVVAVGKVTGAAPDLVYVVCTYTVGADTGYGTANTLMAQCVDMAGNEVKYPVSAESANYTGAPADVGKLATVTLAYDATAKTNVAKFTEVPAGAASGSPTKVYCPTGVSTAVASGSPVITGTTHYFGTDTVVLFVNGSKNTLKVTALTGAQALKGGAETYTYYATQVGESTSTNYAVKYVVVKGTPTGSAASGLMFVPAAFDDSKQVTYTNANGIADKASVHAAYVDGTPNPDVRTVVGAKVGRGFYTYTVNAQGIYTLTPFTEDNVGFAKVTNQYGSLVSLQTLKTTTDLDNLNGASTFVADPIYAAATDKSALTNHTALTDLKADDVVAYILSADAKSVVGLYYMGPVSGWAVQTYLDADVKSSAAPNEGVFQIDKIGSGVKYLPGELITVSVKVQTAETTSTKNIVVTLKNGSDPLGTTTFVAKAPTTTAPQTISFYAPATQGTLTLEAAEVAG